MTNLYNVAVRTEHPVPPDVLVEHIAVAIRAFNFTGKVDISMTSATTDQTFENKAHPFDGPEVFDDTPQHEDYEGHRGGFAAGGYTGSKYQPVGTVHKGEFHFPKDTIMGGPAPADPYPLLTRVMEVVRARRKEGGKSE